MTPPPYKFVSYDLDMSLEVAEAIDGLGGIANADQVADKLNYSGKNNGAYLTRMANAKLFGLVEGTASALRPTKLAIDILRPDYPETALRARIQAFENVPLFKAFLDHYHGQMLPDENGMKNALEARFGINSDRSSMILSRMLDSAAQAGLFATSGRSKMIRPHMGSAVAPEAAAAPAQTNGVGGQAPKPPGSTATSSPAATPTGNSARSNKLIDGALDLLPPTEATWNEPELKQWLAFFTSALRVVYKLPEPKPVLSERAGGSP